MDHLVKNPPAMPETWFQFLGREDPWSWKWQPIPIFVPGKSHGQRSLAGYSPWGHKRARHDSVTNHHHHHSSLIVRPWVRTKTVLCHIKKKKKKKKKKNPEGFNGSHKCFTKTLGIDLLMNILSSSLISCLHFTSSHIFLTCRGGSFHMGMLCSNLYVFSSSYTPCPNKLSLH